MDMPNTDARPRRRWLQFGLRTMLLATLILGVGLGYWCNRAARLRKTVAALEALEVDIYWNETRPADGEGFIAYSLTSPEPPRRLGWLGPEYLNAPTSVVIGSEGRLEEIVPLLQTLPKLKAVFVMGNSNRAQTAFTEMPGVDLYAIRHGRCGDRFVESLKNSGREP